MFNGRESAAVYKAIKTRRDVRDQFLDDDIADDVLMRLLDAAHHAPSVGYQQPWNFIILRDYARRQKIQQNFAKAREEESTIFDAERRALYKKLKLEGILKAPLNIVVTCDKNRDGKKGIGRSHNPQMSTYSCVCAVQNFWLAARAENIGVGWVSIYHEPSLRQILNLPEHIEIIAYLCVGYCKFFYERPELEIKGWRQRLPLKSLIYQEEWPQDS